LSSFRSATNPLPRSSPASAPLKPEIIRDEVRAAIRQELGKKPAAAGEFVSAAEAAQIASVASQTIRVWTKTGKLRGHDAGRSYGSVGKSLRTSSPPVQVRRLQTT